MKARRLWPLLLIALLAGGAGMSVAACDDAAGGTTTTTEAGTDVSGDLEADVGEALKVGKAVITVRVLDATFNPVTPIQRMSEATPTAPDGDESFYQAYVKIENRGVTPLRADPEDFACAVGSVVVGIEPTWSGPLARSLLKNSSLEFLITFKAKAGYEPVLLYSPPWYEGTIRVYSAAEMTTTTEG